jgi:16S rRNA (uracil1498-N3)-methyltransferase
VNPRFFVPGTYGSGDEIALPDEEAQHLTRVLRLGGGDALRIFDGRGHEFDAIVATATKSAVRVRVGEPRHAASEPRVAITVAQAVLKGDKMDDVVRDAVMIGVAAIQPIVTTRTDVALSGLQRGHRRDRWHRVAVSSAKQCGRAVVPPVAEPITFEALVDALRQLSMPQPALMLIEPSAEGDALPLADLEPAIPRAATLVIGPEGGWTMSEIARGSAVARLLTLGGRTLRADAMATIAVAALFSRWQEF